MKVTSEFTLTMDQQELASIAIQRAKSVFSGGAILEAVITGYYEPIADEIDIESEKISIRSYNKECRDELLSMIPDCVEFYRLSTIMDRDKEAKNIDKAISYFYSLSEEGKQNLAIAMGKDYYFSR